MSVETEIRARLLANGTVSGLIGTRCYPMKLPQDPTLPALVMFRVSGPRIGHLTGASGWGKARIQIDSWAETYLGAQALAAGVRGSLHRYIGTLTTVKVAISLDNERDDYDDEVEWYRVIQDYTVTHSE